MSDPFRPAPNTPYATLLAPGQGWVSKATGRVIKIRSPYANGTWRVERLDGGPTVLAESEIYRDFDPFNASGSTVTMVDGTVYEAVPKGTVPDDQKIDASELIQYAMSKRGAA